MRTIGLLVLLAPLGCSDESQVLTPPDSSMPDTAMTTDSGGKPDSGGMDATVDVANDTTSDTGADVITDSGITCDADAGQVLCGSMCVIPSSFQNDAKNCGFCGHDCQGQTCTKGKCAPQTLAQTLNNPVGIAVDANNFYAAEYGSNAGNTKTGRVIQCPSSGCPMKGPTIMLAGLYNPSSVAIDANNVYWANGGDNSASNGSVQLCPIAGCGKNNANLKTLASAVRFPQSIAVSATDVYFPDFKVLNGLSGEFDRCAIAGCNNTPATFATGARPWAIALDSTTGFFSTNSMVPHVNSRPLNLSMNASQIDTTQGAAYTSIAVDGTNVYYVDNNNNEVRMCPKASCNNNSVALATNQASPIAIAVDSKGIYWADNGGDISMCPLPGGCPKSGPIVLADGLDMPSAIALDATYVYWTNQGANDNTGTIMRVAR